MFLLKHVSMTGTQHRNIRGFTLLEVLVATAILTVVLVVAVGTYGRFARFQRYFSAEQELQEDIRLALQLFSREARTAFGSTFQVIDNGRGITFRNQEKNCVQYWHNLSGILVRNEHSTSGVDCSELGQYDTTTEVAMTDTSSRVVITKLLFKTQPAKSDPNDPTRLITQGLITIIVEAKPNIVGSSATSEWGAPIQLQTAVTSRQLSPYR